VSFRAIADSDSNLYLGILKLLLKWKIPHLIAWLIGWKAFDFVGFGSLWIIISLFISIFVNLGERKEGEISAYSVFNDGFTKIMGTISADQFENEILHRQVAEDQSDQGDMWNNDYNSMDDFDDQFDDNLDETLEDFCESNERDLVNLPVAIRRPTGRRNKKKDRKKSKKVIHHKSNNTVELADNEDDGGYIVNNDDDEGEADIDM
jgi:hypothetical protein